MNGDPGLEAAIFAFAMVGAAVVLGVWFGGKWLFGL